MGPTWGLPGSDRTQVGPMLAPWILLSGYGHMCVYLCGVMNWILLWILENRIYYNEITPYKKIVRKSSWICMVAVATEYEWFLCWAITLSYYDSWQPLSSGHMSQIWDTCHLNCQHAPLPSWKIAQIAHTEIYCSIFLTLVWWFIALKSENILGTKIVICYQTNAWFVFFCSISYVIFNYVYLSSILKLYILCLYL